MNELLIYRKVNGYVPKFSKRSENALKTCDVRIQLILNKIISMGFDLTVIEGYRNEVDQNKKFKSGESHLRWPNSKHNSNPSMAVDVAPYFSKKDPRNTVHGIPWDDKFHKDYLRPWFVLYGLMQGVALAQGFQFEWGGHWKTLKDYPHFEISRGWGCE